MKLKKRSEKRKAVFQIANLVIALFAFAFLVSLSSVEVSGQTPEQYAASRTGGATTPTTTTPPPALIPPTVSSGALGTYSPKSFATPGLTASSKPVTTATLAPDGLWDLKGSDGSVIARTTGSDLTVKGWNPQLMNGNLNFNNIPLTTQKIGGVDVSGYLKDSNFLGQDGTLYAKQGDAFVKVGAASTGTAYSQGMLAKLLNVPAGGYISGLLSGLEWAAIVGGLAYLAGGLFGMTGNNQMALGLAAGGGMFSMTK